MSSRKALFKILQSLALHLKSLRPEELLRQLPFILPDSIKIPEIISLLSDQDRGLRTLAARLTSAIAPFSHDFQEHLFMSKRAIPIDGWCVISLPDFIVSSFEQGVKEFQISCALDDSFCPVDQSQANFSLFLSSLISHHAAVPFSSTSIFTFPKSNISAIKDVFSYSFPDPKSFLIAFRYSIQLPQLVPREPSSSICLSREGKSTPRTFSPRTLGTSSTGLLDIRPSSMITALVHDSLKLDKARSEVFPTPRSVGGCKSSRSLNSSSKRDLIVDADLSSTSLDFYSTPPPKSPRSPRPKSATPVHQSQSEKVKKSRYHTIAEQAIKDNTLRRHSGLYGSVLPLFSELNTKQSKSLEFQRTSVDAPFLQEELSKTLPGSLSLGLLASSKFSSQKSRARISELVTEIGSTPKGNSRPASAVKIPQLNLSTSDARTRPKSSYRYKTVRTLERPFTSHNISIEH
ncbi:hypothetical protein RCL1_002437 [Eukaryota sp. TZLM3-RCL]